MSLAALKIRLEHDFQFHPPGGNQAERYEHIRRLACNYGKWLAIMCPLSRELSVALTKLDEVVYWANASIARNEKSGTIRQLAICDDAVDDVLDKLIEEENVSAASSAMRSTNKTV